MTTARAKLVTTQKIAETTLASMRTSQMSFSGHQTFSLRYSWLAKGVALLEQDPAGFFADDAPTQLGVGKNMVDSIRHWCEILGLAQNDGRIGKGYVKEVGTALFGKKGFDPYLEHSATLWFLHWELCKATSEATTWHFAFSRWNKAVFTRDELVGWLLRVAADAGLSKVSRASLKRDVDVFLRTYVSTSAESKKTLEDSFDCPLTELGLIRKLDGDTFEFRRQAHASLPSAILAYALSEFWDLVAPEQRTLSFERVMYDPGSPGNVFQLSELGMTTLLTRLPTQSRITFDESAGMRRLVREGAPKSRLQLLELAYQRARS